VDAFVAAHHAYLQHVPRADQTIDALLIGAARVRLRFGVRPEPTPRWGAVTYRRNYSANRRATGA